MTDVKVNIKYQTFAAEYLKSGNRTKAAIAAGYSEKTAYSAGYRLLKRVEVQQLLKGTVQKATEKLELTAERLLTELTRIAFFDMRKLFNEHGKLLSIDQLDDDTAAALAGIDVDELFEFNHGEKEKVGHTRKVRTVSKIAAIQELMAHLGLNKAPVDNKKNVFHLVINLGEPTEKTPGDRAKVINNDQLPTVRL